MTSIKNGKTILFVFALLSFGTICFSQNLIVKGDTLFARKEYKEALFILNKAIIKYPDSSRAYFYKASSELELHMYDTAISDFNKSIELHLKTKDLTGAYYSIGMIKSIEHDYTGGIYYYNQAIGISPNEWLFYYAKANNELDIGDNKNALEDINIAAKLNTDSAADIYNLRGLIKFYTQDTLGALQDFSTAIRKDSNNPTPYYGRVNLKIALKEYRGALMDINKVLKIDTSTIILDYRGNIKEKMKDTVGAMDDYNKLLTYNPTFARGYFDRGCLEEALKKYPSAISDFTKAMENYPEYIPYYIHRGTCYEITGRKEDGCNDYHKALDMGDVKASDLIVKYCR